MQVIDTQELRFARAYVRVRVIRWGASIQVWVSGGAHLTVEETHELIGALARAAELAAEHETA